MPRRMDLRQLLLASALLCAGPLGCGAHPSWPAQRREPAVAGANDETKSKIIQERARDPVVSATAYGEGHYSLVYESGACHEIQLLADRVRVIRRTTIDEDTIGWYYKEWRKDRTQMRSNRFVSSGDRSFAVLGGRVLGYRESDGDLLQSAQLTTRVSDRAFIMVTDGKETSFLVEAERAMGVALVELRESDLSLVREIVVPARPGQGELHVSVGGDRVYVAAFADHALGVRTLRRSDLTLMHEAHVPVSDADGPRPTDPSRVVASPGGRFLAAHLRDRDRVLVIDTTTWRVVRDLRGFHKVYQWSSDERVLMLGVPCASAMCPEAGEAYVYPEREGPELRARDGEYAVMELERGFAWAVSADLSRVLRWDFDDLGNARSYPLGRVLTVSPHYGVDGAFSAERGRVDNYPLSIAFDRRGQLWVSEWDGRELLLFRVHEDGAETLLRTAQSEVQFVHVDVSADVLVVVTTDGALTVFDLGSSSMRMTRHVYLEGS